MVVMCSLIILSLMQSRVPHGCLSRPVHSIQKDRQTRRSAAVKSIRSSSDCRSGPELRNIVERDTRGSANRSEMNARRRTLFSARLLSEAKAFQVCACGRRHRWMPHRKRARMKGQLEGWQKRRRHGVHTPPPLKVAMGGMYRYLDSCSSAAQTAVCFM